jgi:hypothetical protein
MSIDTYRYQETVFCGGCGSEIRERLLNEGQKETQDEWLLPQGPVFDYTSDQPEECASCHLFLRNDLSTYIHLYEKILEELVNPWCADRVRIWIAFYKVELFDLLDHTDPKEESTEPDEEECDEQLRQD